MNNLDRLKLAVSLGSVSVLAFVFVQACGGDDSNTGDSGGLDSTTNDVVVTDTGAGDVKTDSPTTTDGGSCPSYSGSNAFCTAALAHCASCGEGVLNLNTCQVSNFTAVCDYFAPAFSQAFANAESACSTVCDAGASNACIKASLADASLTTAQQKTATDYCARCGDGGAGCAPAIASQLNFVEISDSLVGQIDTLCTPDAGGPDSSACGGKYGACALGLLSNAISGGPCSDAGGQ